MSVEKHGFYLGGSRGIPPEFEAYRNPDHEGNTSLMLYLKDLGRTVEKGSLGVWSGKVNIDPSTRSEMKNHFDSLISQTTASFGHPHPAITQTYRIICQEETNNHRIPANPHVYNLAQTIDNLCHVNTLDLYARLQSVSRGDGYQNLKDDRVRHWLEATLAITRQCLDPLELPVHGKFLPNVYPNGGHFGQFDGLIVPSDFKGDINWLQPPHYFPVEIKTPFRVEDIIYPARRVGDQNLHLHQMMHRLAQLALKQSEAGFEPNFPSRFYICYLRGSTPPSFWSVELDRSFFDSWIENLELDIDRISSLPPQYQAAVTKLFPLLTYQSSKLHHQEDLAHQIVTDLSTLVPGILVPLDPEIIPVGQKKGHPPKRSPDQILSSLPPSLYKSIDLHFLPSGVGNAASIDMSKQCHNCPLYVSTSYQYRGEERPVGHICLGGPTWKFVQPTRETPSDCTRLSQYDPKKSIENKIKPEIVSPPPQTFHFGLDLNRLTDTMLVHILHLYDQIVGGDGYKYFPGYRNVKTLFETWLTGAWEGRFGSSLSGDSKLMIYTAFPKVKVPQSKFHRFDFYPNTHYNEEKGKWLEVRFDTAVSQYLLEQGLAVELE